MRKTGLNDQNISNTRAIRVSDILEFPDDAYHLNNRPKKVAQINFCDQKYLIK